MSKKLKIAVIGTGSISREHLDAYKENPNVEIYALCDINKERVEKRAAEYNVPLERTFTDKDEMFKALPEIDAVSVCTWNSAHAECSIAALNAGKHVLCEKPMAMNEEEAKEMKAAADKAGKLLMIGFVRRHGNDCALLKDYIDKGYLGEIYYAKAQYLRRNGNPGGWFGDKSRSGGGPLIDLGVHVIDLVRYLMGNPNRFRFTAPHSGCSTVPTLRARRAIHLLRQAITTSAMLRTLRQLLSALTTALLYPLRQATA